MKAAKSSYVRRSSVMLVDVIYPGWIPYKGTAEL